MATGAHQGCPFSMGLFSIITGQLADAAAKQFPDAVITAYADDIIYAVSYTHLTLPTICSV
eukprot:4444593-Prorocentrum_lima.AAC.1